MEELYEEMKGRLEFLKKEPKSDFNHGRIAEMNLCIFKVQQILLSQLNNKLR